MAPPGEQPAKPARKGRSSLQRGSVVVVLGDRIDRCDVRGLYERVHRLLEDGDVRVVVCELAALIDPDAVTVDALARLQLAARRSGSEFRLLHACDALRDLVALMGLRDLFAPCEGLPLEARGQAEEGEQACSVEEESDAGDAAL